MANSIEPFQPFLTATTGQTKRYRAACKILLSGVDVTDRLDPHLTSVNSRLMQAMTVDCRSNLRRDCSRLGAGRREDFEGRIVECATLEVVKVKSRRKNKICVGVPPLAVG